MHGLIFVTWEKYLSERFGKDLLQSYRTAIDETVATAPLATRLYSDATLLAGVGAASKLTNQPAATLLQEYGRYFIINGLTSYLCTYVLSDIHSGRDLLLTMRDVHARLRRTRDGLTPPLFNYEMTPDPHTVILIYDSDRNICPVLWGAIEGAAERYGESVHVVEHSCMQKGASVCRFEARFSGASTYLQERVRTPEQQERNKLQKQLARKIMAFLPEKGREEGVTLEELQKRLQLSNAFTDQVRPAVLLEALQHLQFAGYVASSADQVGDNLASRRYWRVPFAWTW